MQRDPEDTDFPQFPIVRYPSTPRTRLGWNFSSYSLQQSRPFPGPLPRSIYFGGPRVSVCRGSVNRREVIKAKL